MSGISLSKQRDEVFSSRNELSIVDYLKQVYSLIAGSLFITGIAGYVSMGINWSMGSYLLAVLVSFGLLFVIFAFKNTASLILFSVLQGMLIAPAIAHYVNAGAAGVVGLSVVGTGAIFIALSLYAMVTKRRFEFLGGFLFIALLAMVIVGIANLFLQLAFLSLAMAYVGLLVFSGFILYDTQEMVYGERQPPVIAALGLYLDILNLFMSLLRILGSSSSKD